MIQNVLQYQACGSGVIIQTEEHTCKIVYLSASIIRMHYCFSKEYEDAVSYAVLMQENPHKCGYLQDEVIAIPEISVNIETEGELIRLASSDLEVTVQKKPFSFCVRDKSGRILHRNIIDRSYDMDSNQRRYQYFALDGFDAFYGFGEKGGALNKFKRRLRMYSCDTLGYDSEKTDPLYKHIPFFIKKDTKNGTDCGVLFDSPSNAVLDIGCERSGYWEPYGYFCCDEGNIDCYIIGGDSMKEIVRSYTDLTGKTKMPTYQSLGYMASTMYFTEVEHHADEEIKRFIEETEDRNLGCDGFHLSSGYTSIGEKRYVFNWNNERFPDPKSFVRWMSEHKVLLSPNIKPALLTDHPLYQEFAEGNAFLIDQTTGKPYLERYWGGMASFVDFTSPLGRSMWKKHLTSKLLDMGITAIWDDNNEYEINSVDAVCEGNGISCKAKSLKPIFANLMAKTAIEAMKEHNPNLRAYVLSRAGYAGIQRYAQTWAGDNYTSWNNLKYNIPVMLGMGLSGVANQGCDISGFQGPSPDAELFVRWVQNGIFQPRFSIHSCNTDNTVTQPWSYEGCTPYIKQAFDLRYQLGLYLYSLFRKAAVDGDPIMRPMVYEFESDLNNKDNSFDFMFGPFLLVANVVEEGAHIRSVYLPEGVIWYEWGTHKPLSGGQTIEVDAPLGKIPLFYRSGSIIPLIEAGTRMEQERFKEVRLLVEASEDASFTLYQDDGSSMKYVDGDYLETQIKLQVQADYIDFSISHQGKFKSHIEHFEILMTGRREAPLFVTVGGQSLEIYLKRAEYNTMLEGCYFDMETRQTHIKVMNCNHDYKIHLDFKIKDLIGM